jgi:lipopolysaccharide transport system permease protein
MLFSAPAAAAPDPVVHSDSSAPRRIGRALEDLSLGFRRWRLPVALAQLDIRNRYRGSVLGPMWLTLSTAVTFIALGLLYSTLFKINLHDYLPFLVVSLILWNVFSQLITEACTSLVVAEGIIRQLPLPFTVHALRCLMRNAVIAAHNLPLILVVFLIFGINPGLTALLAIPGLMLFVLNAFALVMFLGMLCARFRDIGPIVGTLTQLAFFMSPVIWKPELLHDRQVWLVLNPVFDLMEVVRGPLLGQSPSLLIWAAACGITTVVCALSFAFFVRFRGRIAFWV